MATHAELEDGQALQPGSSPLELARRFFAMYDKDLSGGLDEAECRLLVKDLIGVGNLEDARRDLAGPVDEALCSLDADGDGLVRRYRQRSPGSFLVTSQLSQSHRCFIPRCQRRSCCVPFKVVHSSTSAHATYQASRC